MGPVQQERSGRISRCSLTVGALYGAAVWLNRYSKYWQEQFDTLAATLAHIDALPQPARRPGANVRGASNHFNGRNGHDHPSSRFIAGMAERPAPAA